MDIYIPLCWLAEKARFDIVTSSHDRSEAMLENASEGMPARRISGLPHIRPTTAITGKLNPGREAVDFQAAHKIRSAIRACR
jgi:hypothetical protein